MTIRVYVPVDSTALALGAERTARAIERVCAERGIAVEVLRNGSRGMMWLEPLVEVVTAAGRVGYGPVKAAEVEALVDAGMLEGRANARCIGVVDEFPWLRNQERLTFARVGITRPTSLEDLSLIHI